VMDALRKTGPQPEAPARAAFLRDALAGLSAKPKALPPKYFYDAEGSRLFDRICALPGDYPTRTEIGILADNAPAIARLIDGCVLVEPGAGSTVKVRRLLDARPRLAAYVPIDISGTHLVAASRALAADYPDLRVMPLVADFAEGIDLAIAPPGRRVGFFPGSTIGNFDPADAQDFLRRFAQALGPGSGLLIGVDLKKSAAILEPAYDDAQGVTAAFNLNLLRRMNRELGADFVLGRFRHRAFYDPRKGRIEMHLESRLDQTVRIAGRAVRFAAGETIHTENSYKYTIEEFGALAAGAGWRPDRVWTDRDRLFAVHALTAE
jgi:L-histidine Nalpha-methyltransferase